MAACNLAVLTVVIPMAGAGSRFTRVGFDKPKPFIDVSGKTMIERVMDNLYIPGARYVLLAQRADMEREATIIGRLQREYPATFLPVEGLTEGAACTVLQGNREFASDVPLLIANCDQIIDFELVSFVNDAKARDLDGSILIFRDVERSPKWSFARLDERGFVCETREKVAISDLATVGIYLFRRGNDFVYWAADMISRNERVNNEYYVCPIYNYGIRRGARIGTYEIPATAMHGIGTPEDLAIYLARGAAK